MGKSSDAGSAPEVSYLLHCRVPDREKRKGKASVRRRPSLWWEPIFCDVILPLDFQAISEIYQPYSTLNTCVFLVESCEKENLTWSQEPRNQGGRRKVSLLLDVRLESKSHFMKLRIRVYQRDGLGDVLPASPFREGHVIPAIRTA